MYLPIVFFQIINTLKNFKNKVSDGFDEWFFSSKEVMKGTLLFFSIEIFLIGVVVALLLVLFFNL